MDVLKQMFSSKTRIGRVNRTILQAFIGLCSIVISVGALPEIYNWMSELPLVVQLGGIAVVIGGVSAAQNYAKEVWNKVRGF